MAEAYVHDMRSRQPSGPYAIGGYCFGGNVAYEMARVLEGMGETVDLLLLIDMPIPSMKPDVRKPSSCVPSVSAFAS